MTDQPRNPQQGGQQIQIRMDESKTVTTYANTIRTVPGNDELILDFGLNMPIPTNPGEQMAMQFSVGSRIVMNWTAAKRLMMSLQQAVGAYEQNYGPIEVMPQQPPRKG